KKKTHYFSVPFLLFDQASYYLWLAWLKCLPNSCLLRVVPKKVNMIVHLESLMPKYSKEENLLYHMIYFIWFVVYVHTAGVYVDQLLSKLLLTHHSIKNEV